MALKGFRNKDDDRAVYKHSNDRSGQRFRLPESTFHGTVSIRDVILGFEPLCDHF